MWSEPILHVDMDSFFVEVERLDDPSLRGVPVAVGGSERRGVIASASYEAREFGVHSAQPTARALRMCPELRVVTPSHHRYSDVSAGVFEILRSVTPLVESLSLDEAFLDVGGLRLHHPSAVDVGELVRRRLRDDLGLPASVGVASVKFIAKLASEAAKPDGILHVPAGSQKTFLAGLRAESMWGVGPATLAALTRLGVETVGDIASSPVETLVSALGPTAGRHLHDLANGIDPRAVVPDTAAKSVSVEETYPFDLETPGVIETALLDLAHRLSSRLRVSGLRCRTVTLKVRMADFTTVTRSTTVETASDGPRRIYGLAVELLASMPEPGAVRLLGLGGTSLESASEPVQSQLDMDEQWERVEQSLAEVQARFGAGSIGPARLLQRRFDPNKDEEL